MLIPRLPPSNQQPGESAPTQQHPAPPPAHNKDGQAMDAGPCAAALGGRRPRPARVRERGTTPRLMNTYALIETSSADRPSGLRGRAPSPDRSTKTQGMRFPPLHNAALPAPVAAAPLTPPGARRRPLPGHHEGHDTACRSASASEHRTRTIKDWHPRSRRGSPQTPAKPGPTRPAAWPRARSVLTSIDATHRSRRWGPLASVQVEAPAASC